MAQVQTEFMGRVPAFFDLLGQQNTSIPIQSQWVLVFDHFPTTVISDVKKLEQYAGAQGNISWDIQDAFSKLVASPLQQTLGCIFAQGIQLPPDGFDNLRVGEYYGGYVKGLISTNRKEFGTFGVSFLETNLSFAEGVLRPWSIVVAHKSLIARGTALPNSTTPAQSTDLKTTITVYQLGKAGYGVPPVIRKQFSFYNCVPSSIDSEEYSYEGEKVIQRQVEFLFSYYTVQNLHVGTNDNIQPNLQLPQPVQL